MMMIFDDDIDQINVLESSFIDDEYDCPSQRYNPLVQDKNQRLLASLILSNSREGKGKPYVHILACKNETGLRIGVQWLSA